MDLFDKRAPMGDTEGEGYGSSGDNEENPIICCNY